MLEGTTEYRYDGHTWKVGQFPNGGYGFQQDDCPIRYTSKYEAKVIEGLFLQRTASN